MHFRLAEVAKYENLARSGDKKEFFVDGMTGLQIAGICKTFVMNDGRLNEAVKHVCLGIEKGTIFGLLGMSKYRKIAAQNEFLGCRIESLV